MISGPFWDFLWAGASLAWLIIKDVVALMIILGLAYWVYRLFIRKEKVPSEIPYLWEQAKQEDRKREDEKEKRRKEEDASANEKRLHQEIQEMTLKELEDADLGNWSLMLKLDRKHRLEELRSRRRSSDKAS